MELQAAQGAFAKLMELAKSEMARKAYGVGLATTTLYALYRYVNFLKWRRNIVDNYPGWANPSVVLGDLMGLVETGGFGEAFFKKMHEENGEFTRFFLGPTVLNFSTTNPDHVNELYRKAKSRPHETYMFLSYLGKENLLFTHGKMVKQMRLRYGRMISNTEQLRKLNEVAFREFGDLAERWGSQPDGVDVHSDLGPIIYDVMGEVLFGGSWTSSNAGKRIMELHLYLIHNINKWMFWPFPPYFLPQYLEYVNTIKEWRGLCDTLIEERRRQVKANPKGFEDDESALTLLVTSTDENGKPFFSKERAISTMCGFLNGAYDTTHATMYWLTFNLARFPQIQDKLRQEVQSTIGTRTTCSLEELRSIDYLDAYVKESLRFNVTVPVNMRINYDEDMTIGGWHIPKGTNVNVPMRQVFNNHRHFGADTDVFRPERFLPEDPFCETARRALTSFGGHSRMCIGETFAKGELKAYLIGLVQRYTISFTDPSTASDEPFTEAGVNQPAVKATFRFKALDGTEAKVAQNLSWWTPERQARKAVA